MLTIILACINAKYGSSYEALFIVTFILDIFILGILETTFKK